MVEGTRKKKDSKQQRMTRTHSQQRQQSDRMLMTGRAVAAWTKRNEVTPISGANEMVSCARHKPRQERKTPKWGKLHP